jgi:hypothetical protein
MNLRNPTHGERVLGHLEAQDSQQWPIAMPSVRPITNNERELAAMLRRAQNHIASLALLDNLTPDIKRKALAFANEAKALLQRTEGKR